VLDNIVVERTKTESINKAQLADASPSNQQISKANERAMGYFIKYLVSKEGRYGESVPTSSQHAHIYCTLIEKEEEREKKRDENEPDEELTSLARTKALKLWRDLFR